MPSQKKPLPKAALCDLSVARPATSEDMKARAARVQSQGSILVKRFHASYGANFRAKGGPESFLAKGPGQPAPVRGLRSFSALEIINALHVTAKLVS
jgi:hypothetical protein